MVFKYSFLFLSLALSSFGPIYSMSFEDLPQETQELLQAILNKDQAHAERILRENPTLDINIIDPDKGIPYTTAACYKTANSYILNILIDKGLDTKSFGRVLHWGFTKRKFFSIKVFKILIEHGALKQLTTEQKLTILDGLLQFMPEETREGIKYALNNGLDNTSLIKQDPTPILKTFAYHNKLQEIHLCSTYATHRNELSYSVPIEQTTKEHINNTQIQAFTHCREVLDALKKNGLNFTLQTADYKELLSFLANEGSIKLALYLTLHNNLLSTSDLETIITSARSHSDDPEILHFVDNLAYFGYLTLINSDVTSLTNQEKTIAQNVTDFLKKQWLTHKNKSVVKLLRQFALIQRYFKQLTTPEIAHKIAQYAIADFQDQKFDYLPSYEKIQELLPRKNKT